jgi:hypothetical protein
MLASCEFLPPPFFFTVPAEIFRLMHQRFRFLRFPHVSTSCYSPLSFLAVIFFN